MLDSRSCKYFGLFSQSNNHRRKCFPQLLTFAKCSSKFVFASVVSSIRFWKARLTASHWAWRSLKVCTNIPSIILRKLMAEFFSRSALRMFLFEKSSHSSGVTELKSNEQTCQQICTVTFILKQIIC